MSDEGLRNWVRLWKRRDDILRYRARTNWRRAVFWEMLGRPEEADAHGAKAMLYENLLLKQRARNASVCVDLLRPAEGNA